jgi:hypothetical protein
MIIISSSNRLTTDPNYVSLSPMNDLSTIPIAENVGNATASRPARATEEVESPPEPKIELSVETCGVPIVVDRPSGPVIQCTYDQLRLQLKAHAKARGGINALALSYGVTGQFLGAVISGDKRPGPKLLEGINATEVRLYEIPIVAWNGDEEEEVVRVPSFEDEQVD